MGYGRGTVEFFVGVCANCTRPRFFFSFFRFGSLPFFKFVEGADWVSSNTRLDPTENTENQTDSVQRDGLASATCHFSRQDVSTPAVTEN